MKKLVEMRLQYLHQNNFFVCCVIVWIYEPLQIIFFLCRYERFQFIILFVEAKTEWWINWGNIFRVQSAIIIVEILFLA